MSMILSADESRFFENMTIHKQYKEYSIIKTDAFKMIESFSIWTYIFFISGICEMLTVLILIIVPNATGNTLISLITGNIFNEKY